MDQSVTSDRNDTARAFAASGEVPHTQTESTLAPTAEFTRIFLLAWIIRYIFRGFSGATFEERLAQGGIRASILNAFSVPGRAIQKWFGGARPGFELKDLEAASYSTLIGLGSGWLSLRYGRMVKSDMMNLFRESVAEEKGIPQEHVTFRDIIKSDNQIIRRTVENYRSKMWQRLGTDALFFLAAPLRSGHITDGLLGVKGVQIFADTWKRKTTMFEDLVTFVNNKINPRNGLGQPISMGEVFDLYQHYADMFAPDKMFRNVLSRDAAENALWARSQPVFQRITDLMNQSYAYKHTHASVRADFALPKLVYMLGHGLIDPMQPECTMALIEVMNARGAAGVKQAQAMMQSGANPAQVMQQFGITPPQAPQPTATDPSAAKETNGVIAKGSTMQLDAAPGTTVEKAGLSTAQLAAQASHLSQ